MRLPPRNPPAYHELYLTAQKSGKVTMPFGHFWRRIMLLVSASFLLFCGALARAQDSPSQEAQSVAEAARRARDRKQNAAKPSKVITDDDLDAKNVKPGAQGLDTGAPPQLETEPPSPQAVADVQASDRAAASGSDLPGKDAGDPEIAKLKEQIAYAQKALDLVQRELALDQDTYLSNPDHANDKAGKIKLDALQQEISEKQPELDKLKARLEALLEADKRLTSDAPR